MERYLDLIPQNCGFFWQMCVSSMSLLQNVKGDMTTARFIVDKTSAKN